MNIVDLLGLLLGVMLVLGDQLVMRRAVLPTASSGISEPVIAYVLGNLRVPLKVSSRMIVWVLLPLLCISFMVALFLSVDVMDLVESLFFSTNLVPYLFAINMASYGTFFVVAMAFDIDVGNGIWFSREETPYLVFIKKFRGQRYVEGHLLESKLPSGMTTLPRQAILGALVLQANSHDVFIKTHLPVHRLVAGLKDCGLSVDFLGAEPLSKAKRVFVALHYVLRKIRQRGWCLLLDPDARRSVMNRAWVKRMEQSWLIHRGL